MAGYKRVVDPTAYPVTLEQAKEFLRIPLSDTNNDNQIQQYIQQATGHAEEYCLKQWITAQYEQVLDGFPRGGADIWVARPPLLSVESIEYVDPAGDVVVLDQSTYGVNEYATPGRIYRTTGDAWPATLVPANDTVRLKFTAGYGASGDVTGFPQPVKSAVLHMVQNLFDGLGDGEVLTEPIQNLLSLAGRDLQML